MSFTLTNGLLLVTAVCSAAFAAESILARRERRVLPDRKEKVRLMSQTEFARRYASEMATAKKERYAICYVGFDAQSMTKRHGIEAVRRQKLYAAELLRLICEKDDLLAQCGDGFVLMCICDDENLAILRAKELIRSLNGRQAEYDINRKAIYAAGVYQPTAEDQKAERAIFAAQQGWYRAMAMKSDCGLCDRTMLAKALRNQQLEVDFLSGMENEEFCLFLQPVVRADDKTISGAEALVRWRHTDAEIMHPAQFLAAVEAAGHIALLDFVMFRLACRCLEEWEERGLRGSISCNFTRQTAEMTDFAQHIADTAADFRFSHENMVLEITEDIAETRNADVRKNLTLCKEMGFRIALDDVGAGVTSFADLRDYPFDILKIDRSILLNAITPKGEALLGSMIHMAHELGMKAIVEGIETEEQYELVKRLGADTVQGFLFYRPMPDSAATEELLKIRTNSQKEIEYVLFRTGVESKPNHV